MPHETEPVEVACLCANLRMATRAITRRYDRSLAPFGIRTTQFSILARLVLDGPDTVSHGLILLESGVDRRERRASVTPDGEERYRAAYPAWRGTQRELRDELGDDRLPALVGELRDLAVRG